MTYLTHSQLNNVSYFPNLYCIWDNQYCESIGNTVEISDLWLSCLGDLMMEKKMIKINNYNKAFFLGSIHILWSSIVRLAGCILLISLAGPLFSPVQRPCSMKCSKNVPPTHSTRFKQKSITNFTSCVLALKANICCCGSESPCTQQV